MRETRHFLALIHNIKSPGKSTRNPLTFPREFLQAGKSFLSAFQQNRIICIFHASIGNRLAFTKSFVSPILFAILIRQFKRGYASLSRTNQGLGSSSSLFRTIIIACNFISAFRDRIVKIDRGTGIAGIRNEGYYRRIRENLTIHIFFPSVSIRLVQLVDFSLY